ncbi:hypothetical protein LK09_15315 [Microbacterium mangrovi]|uniref:Uncharacterized protein n=1 Tax=Microbacterium mangrovi TaxID=1348253 RepID=A0A0B1ZYS6_9MICO|nr:ABC transporter permease [Microbacterium mangrovi]KHK96355.1 hypothetical protein LK09_15315 [Microbacterium mangrovi]
MIIRAEIYRFLRNGALPALLIIAIGLNALAVFGTSTQLPHVPVATAATNEARTIELLHLGFGASLFSIIFGALSVTRDFGTRVVGRVRLLTGGSGRLLLSRAIVVAPGMLSFGVLGPGTVILVAWIALPSSGSSLAWSADATTIVAGTAVSTVFAGYLGQFVAWQTRRSLLTVIGLVAWTVVLETYAITLLPLIGRFLPGGLAQAMMIDTSTTTEVLDAPAGYLGYGIWLVVLGALAYWRLRRSDLVK